MNNNNYLYFPRYGLASNKKKNHPPYVYIYTTAENENIYV